MSQSTILEQKKLQTGSFTMNEGLEYLSLIGFNFEPVSNLLSHILQFITFKSGVGLVSFVIHDRLEVKLLVSASFFSSMMSMLSSNSNNMGMGKPLFSELKKQASFFFKEKIKTARLALTDVTPAELLTEEVTGGNPLAPDNPSMGLISKAAFQVDDFWRIVEILHKRLMKFDEKNWRVSHNSIILLEHLLTHGPESAAEEFQGDKDAIKEMESFNLVDEKGFDWGQAVRSKAERVLKLLEKGPLLKQERENARKLVRGIQGFGSVSTKSVEVGVLRDSSSSSVGAFRRCCTEPKDHEKPLVESISCLSLEARVILKENVAPVQEKLIQEDWSCIGPGESKPFLQGRKDDALTGLQGEDEHHPFSFSEKQTTKSLLLV